MWDTDDFKGGITEAETPLLKTQMTVESLLRYRLEVPHKDP